MAILSSRATPLDERTNDLSPEIIHSPKPMSASEPIRKGQKLRRMDSSRRIIAKSESDTLAGTDDGIYNASPVDSDDDLNRWKTLEHPTRGLDAVPKFLSPRAPEISADFLIRTQGIQLTGSKSLTQPVSPTSPPLGHSQWPAPHLDTIIEHRRSARALRNTISAPRLQNSPERFPVVVRLQDSIHSLRPLRLHQRPWPRPNPHPLAPRLHQRSFSLSDLDCLERLMKLDKSSCCTSVSCTSSEALHVVSEAPSYPIRPVNSPPERAPTPPGLPSFGTREAQAIRLAPEREQNRRARIFPSWLVHSPSEHAEDDTATMSPPANTMASEDPIASPSESVLKRLLAASGMSRLVSSPTLDQNARPRASLPRGVYATAETGVLALAEDGTAVRGKFGNRNSGHGIGQRNLNQHPLARPDRQSTIEDEVRQIDKACAEMDRGPQRNHLRRLTDIPFASIDAELQRRLSENGRSESQQHHTMSSLPEFLSPVSSRTALPSPAFPYDQLLAAPGASLSIQTTPIPPANSPTSLSSAMINGTMREPPDYAAEARDGEEESYNTRLAAYKRRREQLMTEARQQIEADEEMSKCKRSCYLCCLNNCGEDCVKGRTLDQQMKDLADQGLAPRRPVPPYLDASTAGTICFVPVCAAMACRHGGCGGRDCAPMDGSSTPQPRNTFYFDGQTEVPELAAPPPPATATISAQFDGQDDESPGDDPVLKELELCYNLDGQAGSRREGPMPEWRSQDEKDRYWRLLNHRRPRKEPLYLEPPSLGTQEILERPDKDRAQGYCPYEAEYSRFRTRMLEDIKTDPNMSIVRKGFHRWHLKVTDYSLKEHWSSRKAMVPEFLATRPSQDEYERIYIQEWRPRKRQNYVGPPRIPSVKEMKPRKMTTLESGTVDKHNTMASNTMSPPKDSPAKVNARLDGANLEMDANELARRKASTPEPVSESGTSCVTSGSLEIAGDCQAKQARLSYLQIDRPSSSVPVAQIHQIQPLPEPDAPTSNVPAHISTDDTPQPVTSQKPLPKTAAQDEVNQQRARDDALAERLLCRNDTNRRTMASRNPRRSGIEQSEDKLLPLLRIMMWIQ